MQSQDRFFYVFLDEGGDLNFSPTGSKYFTLSTIATKRPFNFDAPLGELKYNLLELGIDIEYFHASEDRQPVRDRVFAEITKHINSIRIDSLIVEKSKTGPALQQPEQFYSRMLGYLLRYIFSGDEIKQHDEVVVITDNIPLSRKREAIQKAIKQTLTKMLPAETPYRILHHSSKSCFGLQVADYCNWAIYRKWERSDCRSQQLIIRGIRSEFDIFQNGHTHYYKK